MNPKAQVQFVQALVHATYTYLFCTKITFNKENNNCGILGNVQIYCKCYETAKMVYRTYMHYYGLQMFQIQMNLYFG
jgi:hypothetical protein